MEGKLEKSTFILLLGFLLFWMLTEFKNFLLPLVFAFHFSLVLLPMCKKLESHKIPRVFSIILVLIFSILILSAGIWFLSSQASELIQEMDKIRDKVLASFSDLRNFLRKELNLELTWNDELFRNLVSRGSQFGAKILEFTFSFTTGLLAISSLMPIYIFCMLFYREHFEHFLFMIVAQKNIPQMKETIINIQQVAQNYLTGLIIVILIVATLNSIGLALLGIPYALFFGSFAAILTVIPYIGIFIGALIPALFNLVTTGSLSKSLGIIAVFSFVQFLEGNFITPNIHGSRLRLNPFAAIVALIIGERIWGPAGMIISIPTLAIVRILCESQESLRPYAHLLSEVNGHGHEKTSLKDKIHTGGRKIKRLWEEVKGLR